MKPNLKYAIPVKLSWNDEFDGDLSKWHQDTFEDTTWHRAGYTNLELDGSVNLFLDGIRVPGRHASLMNKHRDKVQYVEDGNLILRPYVTKENNPYRDNFTGGDGVIRPMGEFIPWAPWLSTWTSKWSNEFGRHVTDHSKTTKTFGKGSIIECRVNLENLIMAGVRFSMWPMPATEAGVEDLPDSPAKVVAGDSYNKDSSIMEIDGPEVENPWRYNKDFGNNAFMKCIGGAAGDTPRPTGGFSDDHAYNVLERMGIDLRKGYHTFTIVWKLDGTIDFYCDGHLVNSETRSVDYTAYLILSGEMCSGVKSPSSGDIKSHEHVSKGPKMPSDPGLSARCWIDDLDLADKHHVKVDYVRIWDILDGENKEDESEPSKSDETGLDYSSEISYLQNEIKRIKDHSEAEESKLKSEIAELKGILNVQAEDIRSSILFHIKAIMDLLIK